MMGFKVILFICLVAFATVTWAQGAEAPRVLILLGEGYNNEEFWTPYTALQAAGYQVDIAGVTRGKIVVSPGKVTPEKDATANLTLDEVQPQRYLGLLIPGGYSPGNLESHPLALDICRTFMQADKPVAAICHGPRLLMRANLLHDRIITCLFAVSDELADAWAAGAYGAYVDAPVVRDGNLVTARYPGDSLAHTRAFLEMLAAVAGGLPIPTGQVRTLVIGTVSAQQRLQLGALQAAGLPLTLLRPDQVPGFVVGTSYRPDALRAVIILAGVPGQAKPDDLTGLLAELQRRPAMALLAAPDADTLLAGQGVPPARWTPLPAMEAPSMPTTVASLLHPLRQPVAQDAPVTPTVAVRLAPVFSGRALAALQLALAARGEQTIICGERPGWVRSLEGQPVLAAIDWAGNPCTAAQTLLVDADGVHGPLVNDTLRAQVAAAMVDTATARAGAADAAIALRAGFDGPVVAALQSALATRGYRVRLIGPTKGTMTGLNGWSLTVGETYAEALPPAVGGIVVLPGGLWPEKTETRQAVQPAWVTTTQNTADLERMAWIKRGRTEGATLLAVGLDSLRLGRSPEFKGLPFSATEQARWSFPGGGGKYSSDPAQWSTVRVLSVSGSAAIAKALALLDGGQR